MKTSYINLCMAYDDPVWGREVLYWMRSPLIRVTRNNLGKGLMEFVGSRQPVSDRWKRDYPLTIQAGNLF